ncbi:helix-turn-helix domain-containing protein [Lactobacillus delbrueckii]|uniref:helix-turn-helix domain-containing protein n=1 Tax=Lactobacillus delbrueckii TaxID=1584 RepID=UPI003C12BF38
MKSSLGKTLREIRVGKQVSICSLADQHLSKSQISRFERGESEISCANLINILDKLNVSLDEFMIIHNDVSPTRTESFFNLMSYIRKAYFAQNTAEIMNLLSANSSFKLNPFRQLQE